mmetsp:Transcript_18396/g.45709  ORF Transcript_18396/g.45709 Transcript_18396/m.45709 type:complete len:209 (-) Transcript_18396:234-860(-)
MAVALVGKLGLVAIKQISKPVASFVKREAKAHPMLAFPLEVAGGVTHRLSINFQRLVLGKSWLSAGSIHTMSPLTREHAIDQGAELLGESVIFGIAGATVAFELIRQNRAKEAASAKSEANERLKWEVRALAAPAGTRASPACSLPPPPSTHTRTHARALFPGRAPRDGRARRHAARHRSTLAPARRPAGGAGGTGGARLRAVVPIDQ